MSKSYRNLRSSIRRVWQRRVARIRRRKCRSRIGIGDLGVGRLGGWVVRVGFRRCRSRIGICGFRIGGLGCHVVHNRLRSCRSRAGIGSLRAGRPGSRVVRVRPSRGGASGRLAAGRGVRLPGLGRLFRQSRFLQHHGTARAFARHGHRERARLARSRPSRDILAFFRNDDDHLVLRLRLRFRFVRVGAALRRQLMVSRAERFGRKHHPVALLVGLGAADRLALVGNGYLRAGLGAPRDHRVAARVHADDAEAGLLLGFLRGCLRHLRLCGRRREGRLGFILLCE